MSHELHAGDKVKLGGVVEMTVEVSAYVTHPFVMGSRWKVEVEEKQQAWPY